MYVCKYVRTYVRTYVCTYVRSHCAWGSATIWTDSTENATPPKSIKSRNSNYSVQIQINPESRFGFVTRDMEESEFVFFDLVDVGDAAFGVETVIVVVLR